MSKDHPADTSGLSGTAFLASEVTELYAHRPPYAEGVFELITQRAAATGRLLDLGCGEGKIARPMAKVFDHVVAVDPSANMMALGQSLANGQARNIEWVRTKAEDAPLRGPFDVVSFAQSIHWMDPARLFAGLRSHLSPKHLITVVEGDHPHKPPWQKEWDAFLESWIPKTTGRRRGSAEWRSSRVRHLDHLDDVETHELLSSPFEQTIGSFVLCQHSRSTFTLSRLGALAEDFRRELEQMLQPYLNADGRLSYRVCTRLTLARLC